VIAKSAYAVPARRGVLLAIPRRMESFEVVALLEDRALCVDCLTRITSRPLQEVLTVVRALEASRVIRRVPRLCDGCLRAREVSILV